VPPEHREAFESLYGPDGAWVALFNQSRGYRGTVLLHDLDMPEWYLTIDEWDSERDYLEFRRRFPEQFDRLDAEGERLTAAEAGLGRYRLVS